MVPSENNQAPQSVSSTSAETWQFPMNNQAARSPQTVSNLLGCGIGAANDDAVATNRACANRHTSTATCIIISAVNSITNWSRWHPNFCPFLPVSTPEDAPKSSMQTSVSSLLHGPVVNYSLHE